MFMVILVPVFSELCHISSGLLASCNPRQRRKLPSRSIGIPLSLKRTLQASLPLGAYYSVDLLMSFLLT